MKKIFILFIIQVVAFSCSGSKETREFTFTYSVDLDSSNGKKIELWLPVPQSNTVQTITNLNIDAEDLTVELKNESNHGNKYAYIYSLDGTTTSKKVTMSFDVQRFEHQNANYDNINPNNYLSASYMVPVGSIFGKIVKDNKLTKDNMRGVYDYVLTGMHYGKPTDDKNSGNYKYVHGGVNPKTGKEWLPNNITYGLKNKTKDELVESQKKDEQYAYGNGNSLYACDIGVGNCTDYHSYFISVSRTMNIPARFHMGFPIPNGDEGTVGGYHCWADYYVDNEGWYPVDISEADKDPSRIDYFFGTVCKNRVDMIIGRDFNLKGYEQNPINLFIYPLLEIDDEKSNSFKKKFKYKNL